MKTFATWFQNDPEHPLVYGEAEIDDRPRQRLRGEPALPGVLCESVIVLHHGEKIAEGTPEQVMNDPYVMEVYLGTKGGATHA